MAEVGSIVKVSGSRIATPFGPPRPGQHADEDAEHEPDHHQGEDFPGEQYGKSVEQQVDGFKGFSLLASDEAFDQPFGMITSKATSKVRNMPAGEDEGREQGYPRLDAADQPP